MMVSADWVDPVFSAERDAYVAPSGDGWILLDLAQDAYSCLYKSEPEDSAAEADSCFAPTAILSELGLPETAAAIFRSQPVLSADRSWRELPVGDHVPPVSLILPFLLALMTAGWCFRGRPIRRLIRSIRLSKVSARIASHEIGSVVEAFDTLCLFLPFRPQCLFRCYLLLHFLRRLGYSADWVFGVTLFPFEAHCWLALGNVLIGENTARATQYEPILILPATGR